MCFPVRRLGGAGRRGLAILLAAWAGGCHPTDPGELTDTATAAATPSPAPARSAAAERTRALALKSLAAYGRPGTTFQIRSAAFVTMDPPAEATETLYFTYLERGPDGSSRTGRAILRCRNGGRQLVSFWRREDMTPG